MDKLSKVNVGGDSLLLNNLTLVREGKEIETGDTDSVTIDYQGKRYTIKENEISYRVSKNSVFGPKILVKSLNDLDQSEEETMKINYGTGTLEVPAEAEKVLKKHNVRKDIIEITDFDKVLTGKLSATEKSTLEKFDEEITKASQAAIKVEKEVTPETAEVSIETPAAEVDVTVAKAEDGTPKVEVGVTPTPGASTIQTSNVFGEGTKPKKSEAEVEADRQRRLNERNQLAETIKKGNNEIESLREARAQISDADEAITSLRRLLTIDNSIPAFRTLVTSDTRLKAVVKDSIKPADRKYHPSLQNNPQYKEVGSAIPLKMSDANYKLTLVESAPPQPRGYFIFVPKALELVDITKLNLGSNRQAVVKAEKAMSEGHGTELVVKYFAKTDIMAIMILLKADLRFYDDTLNAYSVDSQRIYIHTVIDPQTGTSKFSLRAMTSTNENTKLSVRRFIPLATHDIAQVSNSDFDANKTSTALFGRLLFDKLEYAPTTKFEQLRPEAAQQFTKQEDGTIVFNQFQNQFEVPAYESTTRNPQTTTVPLPKVVEKVTSSNNNVRVVFSRSSHTETASYNPLYIQALEKVGGEINKNRRETMKSQEKTQRAELALEKASLDLLSGQEVVFK